MANSPHQPESLCDKITRLKAERCRKQALLEQMETLGQTTSAAGMSTTFPSYKEIREDIRGLDAQIESLTAQLVGDPAAAPGVNYLAQRSDYC